MPRTLGSLSLESALLTAAVSIPLAVFGPPGGDEPAHLYRTELVGDGVLVWDNLWYGGHYPLASYSVLYYVPATLVGNVPLAIAAVIASAALFASITTRAWGDAAVWPSRAFAVVAAGPVFTGTYTYALGLATVLGSLRALQSGRWVVALVLAVLTLGFAPLAFVFLCMTLLAVALARARADRRAVGIGAALAVLAGVQATAIVAFPHEAVYPFRAVELGYVLLATVIGTPLALRGGSRVLAYVFLLWGLFSVVAFFVPSPIGENVTRLRGVLLPLALLAAILARFRPVWLAVPGVAAALAYNLVPYVAVIPSRTDGRPAEAAYWELALRFLRARSTPDYRVEIVPTADHWEAYWVPEAGFALARGWYRQLDIAQNPLFYREPLRAAEYRAWLRGMGVRYVLLPDTQIGRYGEEREAELLRSGRSGLDEVGSAGGVTIYQLPGARPILTGPRDARITALGHERVAGWTAARGDYRLAIRFTPYWRVEDGSVCLERAPDGMTRLHADEPGPFALSAEMTARGSAAC